MARSRALLNVLNAVDAATEELPVDRQFLMDLKASIELQDKKDSRKPSQTYKPSSMNCIRNMYYQVTGAEGISESMSSDFVGICQSGSDRHERIQQSVCDMKGNGIDCEYVDVAEYVKEHNLTDLDVVKKSGYETKLYNKVYNMSFLCDGIIKYHGKYYILEIKTETANKFWDQSSVQLDHYNQGIAYSLNFGIEDVIFVYENRDNCMKKAYLFHVTDEMRAKLAGKIIECDGYVTRKICPPKPANLSKKTCAYCGYAALCKLER